MMGREVQRPHEIQEERVRPASGVQSQSSLETLISLGSSISARDLLGLIPAAEQQEWQASRATTLSDRPFFQRHTYIASDLTGPQVTVSNDWLRDALAELEQIDQEAIEEGYPLSNEASRENTKHIITELAKRSYPTPAIYPTEDGEIAILFQNRTAKTGVLILCDRDGGAACFSTTAGKKRRARYDDASDLPDAFIRDELRKLRPG